MTMKVLTVLTGTALALFSIPTLWAAPPAAQPPTTQNAAASRAHPRELAQWESRMRLLQEQMRQIQQTRSPAKRSKLLREHMQIMLEQMQAMRGMGGSMMYGMMGRQGMGGGMMGRGAMGGGMTGQGMMGGGMMGGANRRANPAAQRQWMRDRLDMMQMMMEQMMAQMQAMQQMGPGRPSGQ